MANAIVNGKCLALSVQETSKKNPFIWSEWESEAGEKRYWVGYLVTKNENDKSIRRSEMFLRDLGWERPISGKPMTEEEVRELSEFLAHNKPKPTEWWPMISGQTFQVHAPAAKAVADAHNRIPIWQSIGSATQEPEHAPAPKVAEAPPQAQEQAVAQTAQVAQEQEASVPAPQPAPVEKPRRMQIVEVIPAETPSEPARRPTAESAPAVAVPNAVPEVKSAMVAQELPQQAAPAIASRPPEKAKWTPKSQQRVASHPEPTPTAPSVPTRELESLKSQIVELRGQLASAEADVASMLQANSILSRQLDNAESNLASAGTTFARKVLEIWWAEAGVPSGTPKDAHSLRLFEDGLRAIEARNALRLVVALRELSASLPRAASLKKQQSEEPEIDV